MTLPDVFLLAVAVLGGASALLVVTSRNVVHAALYLVVTLLSIAGVFLLLGAEFLAWAQVLVYVGAVVVLILFGLMLTRAPIGPLPQSNGQRGLALTVSVALFVLLTSTIIAAYGGQTFAATHTTTAQLGAPLYIDWAFPFMALGYLLTVSLIGAIILARQEEGEGPEPVTSDADQLLRDSAPASSDASGHAGPVAPAPGGVAEPPGSVRAGGGGA